MKALERMVKMTQCERCHGQMLVEQDGPTCLQCGHIYRSPEERKLIAEIAAEPMTKYDAYHRSVGDRPMSDKRRKDLMREYDRLYGRRRHG